MKQTPQRLILILTDTYTEYQRQFIDPLSEKLQHLGYGVLVVTGHEISPLAGNIQPSYHAANHIYSIAGKYNASGIIVLTGCVGHNLSIEEIESFLNQYKDVPTVSLGITIPGRSSITVDNDSGMLSLMQHLTANPNRKNTRYLFIRGFKKDKDSMARERVFRDSLARKGIPISEDQFLTGNYIQLDAYNAVDQYLKQDKDIDVVVSANDDMAIAAMRALNKHGLSVPDDVLVTGFDGSPSSRECSPPLTTVSQPISAQADAAIEAITTLINSPSSGEDKLPATTLDCNLIVRRSSDPGKSSEARPGIPKERKLSQRIEDIISTQWLLNYAHQPAPTNFTGEQVKKTALAALNERDDSLKNMLSSLAVETTLPGLDQSFWRQIERNFSTILQDSPVTADDRTGYSDLARLTAELNDFNWAAKERSDFDIKRSHLLQSRLQVMISKCTTIVHIAEILGAYFEQFGVRRGFLVTYEECGDSVDCQSYLQLVFNSQKTTIETLPSFKSHELLHKKYAAELESGLLVLSPLFCGDTQYGYLLIDTQNSHLSLEYLSYTLGQALENIHYLNALRVSNSALKVLASTDSLTGMLRKEAFEQRASIALVSAADNEETGSILFIDLDGFKLVNDTVGHHVGDLLLLEVSNRIKHTIRADEAIARLGGDEFAILLNNITDRNQAQQVATRVLEKLRQPINIEGHELSISASIGIAQYPRDGKTITELLQCADLAMYRAKKLGKNRIHAHSEIDSEELALSE